MERKSAFFFNLVLILLFTLGAITSFLYTEEEAYLILGGIIVFPFALLLPMCDKKN